MGMNYIGVFSFAVSGALKGIEKNMDVFGCGFLGLATAFGGGIIRDLIAGNLPPIAFRSEVDFLVALSAVLFTLLLYRRIKGSLGLLPYFDAVGLGAFCALGGEVALKLKLGPLAVLFAALFTGVGGGVLRDIMAGEIPLIFTREFYATAALIGGGVLYTSQFFLPQDIGVFLSALITIFFRIMAIKRGWNLPRVRS